MIGSAAVAGMSMRKLLIALVAPMYSLLVAALILIATSSPYEAMIGEVSDGKVTTFCDLPRETDDTSDVFMPLTATLVLALLVVGAVQSYRARRIRPSLVCGILLTLVWGYCFFFRRISC